MLPFTQTFFLLTIPYLVATTTIPRLLKRVTSYSVVDTFVGSDFLSGFSFESIDDPANGHVVYVDKATALAEGLASSTDETFTIRADYTTTLGVSDAGRKSVRIKSNKAYGTHLVVFDIAHMPQGCGTWPALWETNDDPAVWPATGEIDIIEGTNDIGANQVTIHTTAGCTMEADRVMTGVATATDCNWEVNGNVGCAVTSNVANSYGPSFNGVAGGWYAVERASDFISVWFWERGSAAVPGSVTGMPTSISSADFGTPIATFPTCSTCDIGSKFGANNIIFDIDLCGDYAEATYAASGCPGTCVGYVNANPGAFSNAFWLINSVRVYA